MGDHPGETLEKMEQSLSGRESDGEIPGTIVARFLLQSDTGSYDSVGEIGCARVCRVRRLKKIKQDCLFRGLSIQLLMFVIAGLDSRLLTAFSVRLGSSIARPACLK